VSWRNGQMKLTAAARLAFDGPSLVIKVYLAVYVAEKQEAPSLPVDLLCPMTGASKSILTKIAKVTFIGMR
jgi:hypothetical protein